MRKRRIANVQYLACIALYLTLTSGCTPYVYKDEISKFKDGVDHLTSAYQTGITEADSASAEEQKQILILQMEMADKSKQPAATHDKAPITSHTAIAWSEGCNPPVWKTGSEQTPQGRCYIRQVTSTRAPVADVPSATSDPRSPITQAAAENAPKCLALKDYAEGLAAITNAADRDALNAAQANLKTSVEALDAHAGPQGAGAGLLVDLFNDITGSALDTRRYKVLQATVISADPAVRKVGDVCGDALDDLRDARITALQNTGLVLQAGLEGTDRATYAQRITVMQGYAETIDGLRQSKPKAATDEMIAAHEQLRLALADNARQIEPVATAIGDFVKKAAAVQGAFAESNTGKTSK